jgi:hypothetical protein
MSTPAKRFGVYDEDTRGLLDWIEKVNTVIFMKFDAMFGD